MIGPAIRLVFGVLALVAAGAAAAWGEDAPAAAARRASAIAMHGEPALPDGFDHWPYVNPDAPKGGRLDLAFLGAFDSLNPYNVKALSTAQGLTGNIYQSLMIRSDDEPFTLYGLIAESVETDPARDRIVFYVAQRRSSDRRDVTSGTLFVRGASLTLIVVNHQNRVDVVPGLAVYDRRTPEVAVAPQRFSLVFERSEFVVKPEHDAMGDMLEAAPPTVTVDYARFLQYQSRSAAAPGNLLRSNEAAR